MALREEGKRRRGDDRQSELRNEVLFPRHGVAAVYGVGERKIYPCGRRICPLTTLRQLFQKEAEHRFNNKDVGVKGECDVDYGSDGGVV